MDRSVYYSSLVDTLLSLSLFDFFFKVDFLTDYFLNIEVQGRLLYIAFQLLPIKRNNENCLQYCLVHRKLNHNHQLILHRQLNSYPALLY